METKMETNIGKITRNNTPIAVDITNNTDETKEIRLFSGDKIAEGVEIKPVLKNITYENICENLKAQRKNFSLIRLFSQNRKQFSEKIKVYKNFTNSDFLNDTVKQTTLNPIMYFSSNQFQEGIIEIPIEFVIKTEYSTEYCVIITVLPRTTIGIRLYEKKEESKQDDEKFVGDNISSFGEKIESNHTQLITLSNKTDVIKKAVLFGFNNNYSKPNFGSDICVEVCNIVNDVTYESILLDSAVNPFSVCLTRLTSTNHKQVVQPIYYKNTKPSGAISSSVIFSESYFSIFQHQSGIVSVEDELIIDNRTELEIDILPQTTLQISLFKNQEVNISNVLKRNRHVLKNESAPYKISVVGSTDSYDFGSKKLGSKQSWLQKLISCFKN